MHSKHKKTQTRKSKTLSTPELQVPTVTDLWGCPWHHETYVLATVKAGRSLATMHTQPQGSVSRQPHPHHHHHHHHDHCCLCYHRLCACACVRVCGCASVCVCTCVCVGARVRLFACMRMHGRARVCVTSTVTTATDTAASGNRPKYQGHVVGQFEPVF